MILNMPVPQVGHFPFIAFLPFFIVVSAASFISLFDLHFTQYASIFKCLKFIMVKSKFNRTNLQGSIKISKELVAFFFKIQKFVCFQVKNKLPK